MTKEKACKACIFADSNLQASADSSEKLAKAKALISKSYAWVHSNPSAWTYIEKLALEAVESDSYTTMRLLMDRARIKDFTDINGKPTKICNTYEPVFARFLVAKYPALKIQLRKSMVDEVGYSLRLRSKERGVYERGSVEG